MNTLKKRLTSLIFIFAVTMPFFAVFAQDWSNRVENNVTVDGKHWGLAVRSYMNYNTSHLILRYKINSVWSFQYRYVTKESSDAIEHRFRLQHKEINFKGVFWNTRIEYRIRGSKGNVSRIRPQTGFKYNIFEKVITYYIAEPHFEYDFDSRKGYFKYMQYFFGFDIKLKGNVSFGPFIEIDTNDKWKRELMFLGTQLTVKLNNNK